MPTLGTSTTTASVNATSIVLDKPSGTVAGDDVIATIVSRGYDAPSNPSFTTLALFRSWNGGQYCTMKICRRRIESGDPASWTFTADSSVRMIGTMSRVIGAHPGVWPIASRTGGDQYPTAPGQTMVVDSLQLAVAGKTWGGGLIEDVTIVGTPAGMTAVVEDVVAANVTVAVASAAVAAGVSTADRVWPGSSSGRWAASAITIPGNVSPSAPVLASPAPGAYVDLAAGWSDRHTFSDLNGTDTPGAFAYRRKVGGGAYEYWNDGTASWQSTVVWNSSTSETVEFPAAAWDNEVTYVRAKAYRDQLGAEGTFGSDEIVIGASPPTVTVTGPASPVTDTSRPTITHTFTDPGEGAQGSVTRKVFTEAVTLEEDFDPDTAVAMWSETQTGPSVTRQIGVSLTNGEYVAFVQAVQATSGQASDWASAAFTVDLIPPSAPTMTAEADPTVAAVRIIIEGTHDPEEFPVVTYRVERSIDDGATWTVVRGGDNLPPFEGLTGELVDLEAPPNRQVLYRASTLIDV